MGRKIGFPTANILPDDQHKLIPTGGVYAVLVNVGGGQYKGMLNRWYPAYRNTNMDHRSIEVHILDFSADIYQSDISVSFVERIRNEVKFGV